MVRLLVKRMWVKMEWISEGELVIKNKVYHILNPEWIKNLIRLIENDNDSTKDQEAPRSS